MPRPPDCAPAVVRMPGSVYSPTARAGPRALRSTARALCPLNVGDTWMEPFEGGRLEDIRSADHPGLNRYCDTRGVPALVDAIVEKLRERNSIPCERRSVLVSAGATGALATAVGAVAAPDEEVLILAPFWPLIRGIVQTFRARPVEVPFYDRVDSAEAAVAAVRERLGPQSVALYVSTPSNPTGVVLPRSWLEALAELARREKLWLVSDEVYEDYVYRGQHCSLASLAPERTLSVFSFSKAYGMAGYRTGYLVGPPEVVDQAEKVGTHTFYCAPTAAQEAARRALHDGGAWVARARTSYREVGEAAAAQLGLPAPEGSTFLFLNVASRLEGLEERVGPGERGIAGFLADCVEDGVALAPGASSGSDYGGWVRLCYTSAPPADVKEAVRRVAKRLG